MSNFFEIVVKNYSGLSSETKPTIAAGNNVPNGSRWREVDTGKTWHFNITDDAWYETEQYNKLIAGSDPTIDIRVLQILEQTLTTLKKIEYHLFIASDTELKDQDV